MTRFRRPRALLLLTCLAAAPATRPVISAPRLDKQRLPSNVVADIDVRYGPAADTGNLLDVYRRKDGRRAPAPPSSGFTGVRGSWATSGPAGPCR